jgi:hypothetical protein
VNLCGATSTRVTLELQSLPSSPARGQMTPEQCSENVSQSRSVEELAPRMLSLCRKSARIFNGSKVVLLGRDHPSGLRSGLNTPKLNR